MLGLYIHIPYCRSKCGYCDFASAAVKGRVPGGYVEAVLRELRRFSPWIFWSLLLAFLPALPPGESVPALWEQ